MKEIAHVKHSKNRYFSIQCFFHALCAYLSEFSFARDSFFDSSQWTEEAKSVFKGVLAFNGPTLQCIRIQNIIKWAKISLSNTVLYL